MNIIVHLMLDETEPVICDPFCGSDCLSLSVPVIFVVVSCVPLGPRVCAVHIGTYRTRAVSAGTSCETYSIYAAHVTTRIRS